MNRDLVRKLILYIVDQLQDMDGEISTIRLVKFLYLIDLDYFIHHVKTLTGIDWIYYHYGPYFYEVGDILRSANIDLDAKEVVTKSGKGLTFRSLEEQDISKDVDFVTEQRINRTLKHWALENTPSLLRYVYNTPPIRLSRRGEHIDFSKINQFEKSESGNMIISNAFSLMLVSESVLSKEWNTPEEDEAWAYLSKGM